MVQRRIAELCDRTDTVKYEDITHIVIHCSATRPDQDIGFEEIDKWHVANGWSMCGYHMIIRLNGNPERGRPLKVQGAHVKGNNKNTWAICLVGGLDNDGKPTATFNEDQMRTAKHMVKEMLKLAPQAEVCGHRDFSPDLNGDGQIDKEEWLKDCPCFDVKHWWKQIQTQEL